MCVCVCVCVCFVGLLKPLGYNRLTPEDVGARPADGALLVMYYAPWCGHCKKLHPVFEELAREAPAGMVVGEMDCTVESHFCNSIEIKVRVE